MRRPRASRARSAIASAAVAAIAVAAGLFATVGIRRNQGAPSAPVGDLPPEQLPAVRSFDGTRLAVRAAGPIDAPVVVLCHGFSLDMSTWSEQWPELARDYRVVAFDFRSHGRSARATGSDLTIDAMGEDVMAVLDATSPDAPAVVIGHSLGATAILAAAAGDARRFTERVAAVVLIGATSSGALLGTGPILDLVRPPSRVLARVVRAADGLRRAVLAAPGDIGTAIAWLTEFGPEAPIDVVDHVVALARSSRREVWTDGLRELLQANLDSAASAVGVPAMVIVGELDRVTPPAAAVALAGALPDGLLAVVRHAGHVAILERPDEVNRHIVAFLRRALHQGAPPRDRAPKEGAA